MPRKAVLFDLDGTLLDTIEDLADSMNRALAAMGFAPRTTDQYKLFVGDGVQMLARRALPADHADEQTVAACLERMQADYANRWGEHTKPYAGIPELLTTLADRHIAAAVLSNKPDDHTRLMVAELLPHWKLEPVRGARPDVPKKPDPTAAGWIVSQLALSPTEVLYLGDTDTDMQTAVAAGMFPAGALWGFRSAEELAASGARELIAHPSQLLDLL